METMAKLPVPINALSDLTGIILNDAEGLNHDDIS